MDDFTVNLLGTVGLSVGDRIKESALDVMKHAGETPAALVIIGYGFGPSINYLREILGLSHPGAVRLVDRLVADGLVERRRGEDKREVALFATKRGKALREKILQGRLRAVRPMLDGLSSKERDTLNRLLSKMLGSLETTPMDRRTLCRLCDRRVCKVCPIPADTVGG